MSTEADELAELRALTRQRMLEKLREGNVNAHLFGQVVKFLAACEAVKDEVDPQAEVRKYVSEQRLPFPPRTEQPAAPAPEPEVEHEPLRPAFRQPLGSLYDDEDNKPQVRGTAP